MTIRICVILGRGIAPGPGERRLLSALAADPRFRVEALTDLPPGGRRVHPLVRRFLDLEQRLFPVPDSAPPLGDIALPAREDFEACCARSFDVALDFSGAARAMEIAGQAAEGLWRLSAAAGDAGLAEARDRAPFTEVSLLRLRPDRLASTISVGRFDTKFLATRNAGLIREKSVQLMVQALARLATSGDAGALASNPVPRRPFGRFDIPRYLAATIGELALRSLGALGERLGGRPGMFFLRLQDGAPQGFEITAGTDLIPDGNRFWADPFLFEQDGEMFVFFEEYDYVRRRGHICVGRIDGDRLIPLGPALQRDYHLSFPFVIRWQGEILMLPETHEAGRLEVWRAVEFPTRWELAATAMEGVEASDSVLVERDGQWWLFTNLSNDSFKDFAAELHLFKVDGPMLTRIEPHPLNPVVIDTTTARAGGRVFETDGRLYRTSQDNSHGTYGFGLNLMEITRLDDTGYAETRVRHMVPDGVADLMGCHHMDAAGGKVVIDLRRRSLGAPRLGDR